MKNLLIIFISLFLTSCVFEAENFSEIGGVLYTFQLPENTTQGEVDELQTIFKKRIASYVKQKPNFTYDKVKQQFSIGVPKSLSSKNLDLSRKLLTSDGSLLMIGMSSSYFDISQKLEKINQGLKENPIEIDGKVSEQYLSDVLELIPSQRQSMPFLGVATISDTGLVMKMIQHENFKDKFKSNLLWTWKVDEQEMKAYLHAYSIESDKIDEANIEEIQIDYSMNGNPALSLTLDKDGTKILAEMTQKAFPTKELIYMFINQELIMSPTVQSLITEGRVQITGDNMEEVIFMKSIVDAGRLPVKIKLIGEEIQEK